MSKADMTLNILNYHIIDMNPAPPLAVPLARIAAVVTRRGGPLLPLKGLGWGLSQVRLSFGVGHICTNEVS